MHELIREGNEICVSWADSGGSMYPFVIGEVGMTHENWFVVTDVYYPLHAYSGKTFDRENHGLMLTGKVLKKPELNTRKM